MASNGCATRARFLQQTNAPFAADFTTVAKARALGVRRISTGGALARTAWTGFLRTAREIADAGTFSGLAGALTNSDLNKFMG